jgi:hypothetical protein
VDPDLRRAYNTAYSEALYARYRERLEGEVGDVPFRLAETPVFIPAKLRDRLEAHAKGVLEMLSTPAQIDRMRLAVPGRYDVPRMDALPTCAQVDFAIVHGDDGELDGRIVELQGFPSLYAFTLAQARAWNEVVHEIPGIERELHPLFGGLDAERAARLLRDTIVAGEDPAHVVLLDIEPEAQKTRADFVATRALLGVDYVAPEQLVRSGRTLARIKDGKHVPVHRIFNRIVFDELDRVRAALPFAFTDDLDVTWCPHPNWYWVWSKYSLPQLDHPAIPRARLVSALAEVPRDPSRFVLKPLFSFAGGGVKIDVTREDIERIPDGERDEWLLQEKIDYARDLVTPEGQGVAVEVRVMCLRPPNEARLRPAWNLVRLSRGKMHGVDHNRDLTWVGSSVGMWEASPST